LASDIFEDIVDLDKVTSTRHILGTQLPLNIMLSDTDNRRIGS
jgi:hypothetical protein